MDAAAAGGGAAGLDERLERDGFISDADVRALPAKTIARSDADIHHSNLSGFF
jgi:hypothetical protein